LWQGLRASDHALRTEQAQSCTAAASAAAVPLRVVAPAVEAAALAQVVASVVEVYSPALILGMDSPAARYAATIATDSRA